MKQEDPCLPAPDRPLLMLRFRIGQESGDIWKRTLKQLELHRGAFDEVWFSTGLGVAPIETHRRLAAAMAENAEQLRKIGIIPSLQFQSTLGHGDSIAEPRDNSGKTWSGYVGKNGEQCRFVNCPRQPGFLRYMEEMALLYGAWKPASVWIDDDLRLSNHQPAFEHGGCYCDTCLAAFSAEEGKAYTREELVAACGNDPALQARWNDFGRRSLRGVAEAIVRGLKAVSPGTRLGLQHNSDLDRIGIFHAFRELTGLRCGSRPGGGAYSDHDPYSIMEKCMLMSSMKTEQCGYDVLSQVCAEIEDCPRVFTSKTPQGLRVESLYALATGMDSVSYFIMDPHFESPEWYGENLFAPIAADADSYREYARFNEGTEPGGVGFLKPVYHPGALLFPLIGVPIALYSRNAVCRMITREAAELLSEDDLTRALAENIVLDGPAVEAVNKRGLGRFIAGINVEPADGAAMEQLTGDPLNDGIEVRVHCPFASGYCRILVPENTPGVRTLGRYVTLGGEDRGVASVVLERPDGTRAAVLGCAGFMSRHLSSSHIRFLYRVMDHLSRGRLPALPDTPVQCSVVPRLMPDGVLRSVAVLNTVISPQRPFAMRLRGVPENIRYADWIVPSEPPVRLELRREGADCIAVIPEIAAWNIGWLKIGR